MMDQQLQQLYSQAVRDWAARITGPTLTGEGQSATITSPLCGSRVRAEITLDADGVITSFGHDVRACALGKASTALLADQIIGHPLADIVQLRQQLAAMLRGEGGVPAAPWQAFAILQPAADFPARHPSILLACDAVLAAGAKAVGDDA